MARGCEIVRSDPGAQATVSGVLQTFAACMLYTVLRSDCGLRQTSCRCTLPAFLSRSVVM